MPDPRCLCIVGGSVNGDCPVHGDHPPRIPGQNLPQKVEQHFQDALRDIGMILRAVHADATPGEKVTRIAWVIGKLPEGLRESVIAEAQKRVVLGWAAGKSPTDW